MPARARTRAGALRGAAAGIAALVLAGCGGDVVPAVTPPASGFPGGAAVRLVAQDLAFGATQIGVAGGHPFTIVLEIREAVPHNVAIVDDRNGQPVFRGAVFDGPATRWYAVPALAPGQYTFHCEIHPSMTGSLTVS